MVTTQEIIERSLYASLMQVALQLGKTINPELYLPVTAENQKRYQAAIDAIGDEFIYIFGVGNNQVRGPKIVPRITIDLNAYYPGNIGVEAFMVGDEMENNEYRQYTYPFETKNVQFDIHLVANRMEDLRLLHSIMYTALPVRGYIKPFLEANLQEYIANKGLAKTGNLYIEVSNYYDHNDQEHGLLEKVYSYTVIDSYVDEKFPEGATFAPITDIRALIQLKGPDGIPANDDVSLHITGS